MKVLVFGGTRFVGRAIVHALLANDFDVTLFNRGTDILSFPDIRRIVGDRNMRSQLEPISDIHWDAVVDVSGYRPQQIRDSISALHHVPKNYLYISTVSAYDDPPPSTNENGKIFKGSEKFALTATDSYGRLKALCEEELRKVFEEQLTVLRPTIIVGAHDYTDRFSWWVRHEALGGTLPVPHRMDQPVQLIDADDLAAFVITCLKHNVHGTFNTVGPAHPLTLGTMIEQLQDEFQSTVDIAITSSEEAFSRIPLLLPSDGSEDGFFSIDGTKAFNSGLTLRPLKRTARLVYTSILEES